MENIKQEVSVKHNMDYLLKGNGNVVSAGSNQDWSEAKAVWSNYGLADTCVQGQAISGVKHFQQKSNFSLEQVIMDNPTLTGPEALELLKKEVELDSIKYKSELQDKLVELSQHTNLFYKFKQYQDVYVAKVTKFTIEHGYIYIYMDCIIKNQSKRIYRTPEVRIQYNEFCQMDVQDYDGASFNNLMNSINYLDQNINM